MKSATGHGVTEYIGNFVYVDDQLKYILTSEGRIKRVSGNYVFEYHLKDHLGNTRVACDGLDNGGLNVVQQTDYYPFGLQHNNTLGNDNKYLYNGKEWQDELGLDWNNYGARMYDAELSRFMTVDPLAEDFCSWTPYHYVHNNPINMVDPTGMSADWFENEITGDVYYNSSMKKGDEGTGAMKGEGWKHMGENGMFGEDDNSVIEVSKGLATGFKTTGKEYTTEATFEGKNAKKFMSGQGFDFKPTYRFVYEEHIKVDLPTGPDAAPITVTDDWSGVIFNEKFTYAQKGTTESAERKYIDWNPVFGSGNVVNTYVEKIEYRKSHFLDRLVKGGSYSETTWKHIKKDSKYYPYRPDGLIRRSHKL